MSDNTVTVPGKAIVQTTSTRPADNAKITSHTTAATFEQVKHLFSQKPLRPPVRHS
jgi:hypothetical protein